MITGLSHRAVVSTCALCVAGVLALSPATAAAGPRAGEPAPPQPRTAMPGPSLLYGSDTQVRPHRGAPEVPEVSALSWLVADADSGEVLAANHAHRNCRPRAP